VQTQVAIVGAGPAGLFLAQLLHGLGIDSVVIESRAREYIENRIRAGVLEHGTAEALTRAGVGDRMHRLGMPHEGVRLRFGGRTHRIDFRALVQKSIMVYGQHEIIRDLVAARIATGRPLYFEVADVRLEDLETEAPGVRFVHQGRVEEIRCAVIAGCDGFHGVCRPSIPAHAMTIHAREYPFGWLGILAETPPASHELIYAHHPRGFALLSMRSPSVSRLYLQCDVDEDLSKWPDERIWSELSVRLADDSGFSLQPGPILQKGVTPVRAFVAEPMRYGRLFLAGDAAHIVPPTGAKGLNLAVADVQILADALAAFFFDGDRAGLDRYSDRCLARVWKVERFAAWMTSMLHRFDASSAFDARVQLAELEYLVSSRAAAETFAENYVGLPLEREKSGAG
jgi:p-hydroxybenzoate 3-monooxygenase